MVENIIEPLKFSDRSELLKLLTLAFKDHPFIPALGGKPQATKAVMRALVDFFAGTKGSMLYGIHKDGKLVCASLFIDSTVEPSTLPLMRFTFSLGMALGWEAGRGVEDVRSQIPECEGKYLELILIGTLPAYQNQGLAEQMLHFIFEEANRQGYKGIIAIAFDKSPAYSLYLKEGFAVEREFVSGDSKECWMRKSIRPC